MSKIALMYAEKIMRGEKTIDDVPERWRAEVEEILNGFKSEGA